MRPIPRTMAVATTALLLGALATAPASAAAEKRFFSEGDGTIAIRSTKNKQRFSGRFRTRSGSYRSKALRQINRVFGGSLDKPQARISVRLIEILSHLRNEFKGGWITVSSGYRSPRYNQRLRQRGGTVAKASLHLYGMAADIKITGVRAKKLWRFVRKHKLGGAGFYGGPWVHVDVGPPRSWTQGTANVRSGTSDHNKRIMLVPEYDIYAAGEQMQLRFARMTAFPIGVASKEFTLQRKTGSLWKQVATVAPKLGRGVPTGCTRFHKASEMLGVMWQLPQRLGPGRYRLGVAFCDSEWPSMPPQITSSEFRVHSRQ